VNTFDISESDYHHNNSLIQEINYKESFASAKNALADVQKPRTREVTREHIQ
jgi:hypothetical protein